MHEDTPEPSAANPEVGAMSGKERDRVAAAIGSLPDEHQLVLRLYFENLSCVEIARRMRSAPEATRKLLSRARARLGLLLMDRESRGDRTPVPGS